MSRDLLFPNFEKAEKRTRSGEHRSTTSLLGKDDEDFSPFSVVQAWSDAFSRVEYTKDQELPAQIAKTGHDIKDVTAVIMGHMHLDHAGGLENFKGTDVPIYIHEKELKHAWFSVATKSDLGVYLPKDLSLDLNWKAFHGPFLELAPGINLRHAPGHTPGLCIMQVNLKESGTWIFTTDQYHVFENYESGVPQGWLARDHDDWVETDQMIKSLQKVCNHQLKGSVSRGMIVDNLPREPMARWCLAIARTPCSGTRLRHMPIREDGLLR